MPKGPSSTRREQFCANPPERCALRGRRLSENAAERHSSVMALYQAKTCLCALPVDFRLQINGLAALVQETLALDPLSERLFAFTNGRPVRARASLTEDAELLRHSDMRVTMRYAHLAPENVLAAAALLESPVSRSGHGCANGDDEAATDNAVGI